MGGVLVNEIGFLPLLHQYVAAVQLSHHPPGCLGRHGKSGLLRLRGGCRRFCLGLFLGGFGCFHGYHNGGNGFLPLHGGDSHRLPEGGRGTALHCRCGGGGSQGTGLGSLRDGRGEVFELLRGHGAEEVLLLCRSLRRLDSRLGGGRSGLELHLGPVGGLVQGSQNAVVDAVEHAVSVEEIHFNFSRVDVHIHHVGRYLQVQHTGRVLSLHQLIPVGLLQSGHQQGRPHRAVVHKKGLQAPVGPGICGLGYEACEAVNIPAAFHRNHFAALSAVNTVDGSGQIPVSRGGEGLLPVFQEAVSHLRMSQGLLLHYGSNPGRLGGIGFHEFHPGRGVEEQIPDNDGGTVGTAGFRLLRDGSPFQMKADSLHASGGFGEQINPADRGNGSQCLSPEAHGGNGGQILGTSELGGGMAQKGGRCVLRGNAAAVVRHPHKGHAAFPDFHSDLGGPGVHGVFQQLLDDGGRPLHHLTGGNQIGDMGGKLNNFGHKITS